MARIRRKRTTEVGTPVAMTSGLFNLPALPDTNGMDLRVYISNFGNKAEFAHVTVNSPEGTGKGVLARARVLVPSMGTAVHKLDVKGLAGAMVEVELALSSEHAKPSVAVVASSGDDQRSERTVFFLPPTAFPRL